MISDLASLIVAILLGTVLIVCFGVALHLAQQRDARRRRKDSEKADAGTGDRGH